MRRTVVAPSMKTLSRAADRAKARQDALRLLAESVKILNRTSHKQDVLSAVVLINQARELIENEL